jgi:hypothetical protein
LTWPRGAGAEGAATRATATLPTGLARVTGDAGLPASAVRAPALVGAGSTEAC